MNKIFTLFLIILFSGAKAAQNPILNSSFENWTDTTLQNAVPQYWVNSQHNGSISRTTGYAGNYAVKGTVTGTVPNIYVPVLTSQAGGFTDSLKFTCFRFWYKCNLGLSGGLKDKFKITIDVVDASSVSSGYGINPDITTDATNWTLKQISMVYPGGPPAKVNITFTVQPGSGSYPSTSTWFIIDSVSFGCGVVGINEIEESTKLQIFPNPVVDNMKIRTEASKPMQITLSDALGRVVLQRATSAPVNGIIQDTVQVESLSSGLYLLMLTSDKKTIFRRVIID